MPWAAARLDRSKAADLVLVAKHPAHHSNTALESFLMQVFTKHASRVRELELDLLILSSSTWTEMFSALQPSSLRLHSLQLEPLIQGSRSVSPTFPNGVLETDNLRSLVIANCDGPWYSLSFPTLTTLKLHNIRNRPPLIEFLELLRGLANLQVLDMGNSLPRGPPYLGHIDPVHLPRLQYLCLSTTENPDDVANIMSRISCSSTPPTIKFLMRPGDLGNYANVESSFSTFFCRLGQYHGLPYRALRVEGKDINLQAWNDDSGSVSMDRGTV